MGEFFILRIEVNQRDSANIKNAYLELKHARSNGFDAQSISVLYRVLAAQDHSILRNYWISYPFLGIRFGWNARRISASTPQNRTYRAWWAKI